MCGWNGGEADPFVLVRYAWRPERPRSMAYRPAFPLVRKGGDRSIKEEGGLTEVRQLCEAMEGETLASRHLVPSGE